MITVTKTYLPNKEKYKEYIDRIYESGKLTNNGDNVKKLERALESYLGVKNVVLVCNGTLALMIAYKLLKIDKEVITTPFSFIATTSSMLWQGIKPVFVDINRDDYNINVKKIEENITDKTQGIIPVHVFGACCDVDNINDIAKKNNLKVIYDASHCFGIKYKNNSILKYGDISTISFHSTKIFHTIEGGALIINDDILYKKAKKMINFGFDEYGSISEVGINAKMNEFQAAMGLCVLEEIDEAIENRRKIYNYYMEKLKDIKAIKLQQTNNYYNKNYSYFPIVFESSKLLKLAIKLMEEEDIYPRRYFYPSINKVSYINSESEMINSEDIAEKVLCLPIYESLQKEEIDKIIKILKFIIEEWSIYK